MTIKDRIRLHPRVWDRLKAVSRLITRHNDPVYRWLDQFSKSLNRPARFIQIGANDGLRNDPVREFVVRDKWTGVFVEPLPDVFELLKANYSYLDNKLEFVCAAVGSAGSEELKFYTFTDEFLSELPLEDRLNYLRKASFDFEHVKKFIQETDIQKAVKKIVVPVTTLNDIALDHLKCSDIDIVIVDAEGYEKSIIMSIDFNAIMPRAIFFESHHLRNEKHVIFRFLEDNGYSILELGGDSVAVTS